MAIFGLLLICIGVVLALVAFFGLGYDSDGDAARDVALFNNNTTPEMVFILGMVAGALVLVGLWFMKSGAQRGWARRKELKRIDELSEKLDEAERRDHAKGETRNDGRA